MSLVAYAVRTTLWRALLGKTYAQDRVYDSQVAPIDETVQEQPEPLIIVATDDEACDVSGHDYLGASRDLDVVIEIALASELRRGGGMNIPHTDEGLEMALNFMTRQVMRVLQAEDDPWAELFRTFALSTKKMAARRGASVEKGVRFAARQIVLTIAPLHEPEFGRAPSGAWTELIAAMRADDILSVFADGLEEEIVGTAISDWARLKARLGLTGAGASAVGIGPYMPGEAPAQTGDLASDGDHLSFQVQPDVEGQS
ncbi:MAG: hypothetical protein K2X62_10575 [Beijerinckiaceae bacterium]|nr:hypothetical protein [Beijerinckiaceae bacterium]